MGDRGGYFAQDRRVARVVSAAAVPIAPHPRSRKARLRAALAVTLIVLVLEVVGGFVSRSLSLVADADHMLAEVALLLVTYDLWR